MKEKAKKFLEALSKNLEMAKEIRDSKDKETVMKVAKAHGFELTEADFIETEEGMLSEDEMKSVAGGLSRSLRFGKPAIYSRASVSCSCTSHGQGVDEEGNPDGSAEYAYDNIPKLVL